MTTPTPTAPVFTLRTACRVCGGPFERLLDLGLLTLSDFLAPDAPDPPAVPLDLVVCTDCALVQLRHTTDPARLYRDRYWYRSGINEVMIAELRDVVADAATRTALRPDSTVLDVGANDGTLLRQYTRLGLSPKRIAVEPSKAVAPLAEDACDLLLEDFFPGQAVAGIATRSIQILTSCAVFYDLDDPLSFVAEVDRLLTPDGVWVVQFQDLGAMVGATGFDNICHEHLCYYSLQTFQRLLREYDLAVRAVARRAINGGSLRITVGRRATAWTGTFAEDWDRGSDRDSLDRFAWRVQEVAAQLRGTIERLTRQDLPVDLYAASTKSSTLLQVCGIDHRRIRQAVERTPEKVGKVTSGTRIPIVREADWRVSPAPAVLVGAWQFKDAFVTREAEYLAKGGSFLVPLPRMEVVCGQGPA